MPVSQLCTLTWEQVQGLNKAKTVAVLPTGAVEAHGPHLPLNTDVIIAEAMTQAGGERLAKRGYEVLVLPTVAYTTAEFGAAFAGTISVDRATMIRVFVGVARSLARHGVAWVAIANAHLDPGHLAAIHEAGEQIRAEDMIGFVFPDLTRKPWASKLGDEFKSGACHAGCFETSVIMAARPALVRDVIRGDLAPNPVSLSKAIRAGKQTFEEAGGPQAYFGYPAAASAEEGERTIAVLGGILEEAVLGAVDPSAKREAEVD